MGKLREKIKDEHMAIGLTIFSSGALLIVLYMILRNFSRVESAIGTFLTVISPFIYGLVIAYLISPIYDFLFKRIYKRLSGRIKRKHLGMIISKGVSTAITLLAFVALVTGFGILVVPRIFDSLTSLVELVPERASEAAEWIQSQDSSNPEGIWGSFSNMLRHSSANITEWVEDNVLPELGGFVSSIYLGIWGTLKTVLNILIGVITSAYILNEREHFKAIIKKTIYGFANKDHADSLVHFCHTANRTFGGFISGKIIDSLIIGMICFAVMLILGLPYAVLVSVIIGVTNVIPFFGPFIGAIPSAFIIAVVDPLKALVFIVMIFLLQQFDGYILGPKILGDSTGISSFWVMFSIIIGGGLFGFLGMVLAVPTFAVFFYYFKMTIERRLAEKGEPVETAKYETNSITPSASDYKTDDTNGDQT